MTEVQNLCNVIIDYIAYNDRAAFVGIVSALTGIGADMLTDPKFVNSINFPLTQVMTTLLFDRNMQGYTFEEIYDSFKLVP